MHWQTKAKLFQLFDTMPLGHKAYSLTQQHITKTLPRRHDGFRRYLDQFDQHVAAFERGGAVLADGGASYMEFGAGWDLFYPLAFAACGVRQQYLFDLNAYADIRWINHVVRGFRAEKSRYFCTDLPEFSSIAAMKLAGIDYRAPADARATGRADDSIDLASTTSVLEHIPAADIAAIMQEVRRICRPGALISMIVDYEDHYGQRDGGASVYNFLRYTDEAWHKFNPDIHYQNRMRHPEYVALFEQGGFDLVEVETIVPDGWEDLLPTDELAPQFRRFSTDELKITRGRFLLRPC